jgi:hypothetical protein
MQTRSLGESGLVVSALSLGHMSYRNYQTGAPGKEPQSDRRRTDTGRFACHRACCYAGRRSGSKFWGRRDWDHRRRGIQRKWAYVPDLAADTHHGDGIEKFLCLPWKSLRRHIFGHLERCAERTTLIEWHVILRVYHHHLWGRNPPTDQFVKISDSTGFAGTTWYRFP